MLKTGERSYAYAKACGIIGKSFIGRRVPVLEKAVRLSELDRVIFPFSSQNLPEKELLRDLEKRIISRSVKSIISIVECFSRPPLFLLLLLRIYEYLDLMNAITASMEKEQAMPFLTGLGRFGTVHFEKWPDIIAMIEETPFGFLLEDKNLINIIKDEKGDNTKKRFTLQSALDNHYYKSLWRSIFMLKARDRYAAKKIISNEISLKNCSWVLRLRTYYGMSAEEIKPCLVEIPSEDLAGDALLSLDFPLDNYSAWSAWRWKGFLNTPSVTREWQADPRHFQNAASRHLFHLARHHFRLNPFSLDTVFCFIKLKQFEEDLLTSSAEGLSIGMPVRDIVSLLGLES